MVAAVEHYLHPNIHYLEFGEPILSKINPTTTTTVLVWCMHWGGVGWLTDQNITFDIFVNVARVGSFQHFVFVFARLRA